MAWITPRDWTTLSGAVVSATHLNTDIRDNMNALSGHAHTGAAGDGTLIGGVNYNITARFDEDFIGGVATTGLLGSNGWALVNTVTYQAGIASHPGVVRLDTGAGSGTRVAINTQLGTSIVPADTFDLNAIIRLNTNDANTIVRVGLMGSAGSNPPNDGIYMEKLAADTQWFGVTRASSTQTRSTAVASTSTSWVRLRVRRVNGTTIGFSVDGGTEQTNTANIPTAGMALFVEIVNSAAASKTIDVDFIRLDLTGISR